MQRLIIRARALAAEGGPLEDKLIVISGRRIEAILPSGSASRFSSRDFVGSRRYLVVPGLIDMHCHGGGGIDADTLGGLLAAAFFHASNGTTGLLLSVLAAGPEDLARRAELVKKARPDAALRLLGLHLEGPLLNPEATGSIPPERIGLLDPDAVPAWVEAADGELKMVTVAPEMPNAEGVIRAFVEAGVVVALGHSLSTAEQARNAVEWGARVVTHLGNAMGPFHQREPGLIGVGLTEPRLTAEIIGDGQHLAAETLSLFLHGKVGDLALVSDCRWVGGLPEGSRGSGGEVLEVREGAARDADGRLAGGIFPLWQGLRTVAGVPGFSFWDAVPMATRNPARVLGLRGLGRIMVGGRADLVLAGPDFTVRRVFCGGEEVFRAAGEQP